MASLRLSLDANLIEMKPVLEEQYRWKTALLFSWWFKTASLWKLLFHELPNLLRAPLCLSTSPSSIFQSFCIFEHLVLQIQQCSGCILHQWRNRIVEENDERDFAESSFSLAWNSIKLSSPYCLSRPCLLYQQIISACRRLSEAAQHSSACTASFPARLWQIWLWLKLLVPSFR